MPKAAQMQQPDTVQEWEIDGPIVITGGGGFVGRHLAVWLRAQGHSVRALDVHPTKPGEPAVEVCDVRDAEQVSAQLVGAGAVIHLAAIVGVQRYVADPLAVLDTNILGTRHVLRAAHAAGIPVVFASTSEVHGAAVTPLHEDEASVFPNPSRPRWSYGVSKLAGEHYAHALHRAGLRVAMVRMFNVYGPGLDSPGKGRVVSRFLGQIQRNEPLTLVDEGTEVRAFCYVDDAVRAIGLVLRHVMQTTPGETAATFAIGRDEPVSIGYLASRMAWFSGHEAGVVNVSAAHVFGEGIAKIPHRVPRLGKLAAATGFQADISLDEGVRRTLDALGMLKRTDNPPLEPLSFVRPQLAADTHLLLRMGRALATGTLTNQGPQARAFERELTERLGVTTCVVSNGTSALVGALHAIGARGTAVLPSFTFAATRNAAALCGLRVCYCDIDPTTWTLDAEALQVVLREVDDVGVILPVTAYGVTPDLDAIVDVAGDIPVVLDDAHGFGASRNGLEIHPGLAATTMSFHATKVLPAAEGGAIAFRDPEAADALVTIRNHGLSGHAPFDARLGDNLKLSELHAAVGRASLAAFERDQGLRKANMARLRARAGAGLQVQHIPENVETNAQNFAVLVRGTGDAATRSAIATLKAAGVSTRRYFWPALHRTAVAHDDTAGALPHTESVSDRVLCLPLYNRMTEPELRQVEAAMGQLGEA